MQESIAERMVAKIKQRLTHFRVGDSLDKVIRELVEQMCWFTGPGRCLGRGGVCNT